MAVKNVKGLAARPTGDKYETKGKSKAPKAGPLSAMRDVMTVAQRAMAGGKQFKGGTTPDVGRMLPVREQRQVRRGFVGE